MQGFCRELFLESLEIAVVLVCDDIVPVAARQNPFVFVVESMEDDVPVGERLQEPDK